MINRGILKTTSILLFSASFLLGSVTVPFLSNAGADSQIDFAKLVKQEGESGCGKSEITVTDTTKPVIFCIYVYNPTETPYTNTVIRDEFPFDQTGRVKNRALLDSDQLPLFFSDAFVNLPSGKKLVYKPNSTKIVGVENVSPVSDLNGLSPLITPQGIKIGQVPGGDLKFRKWYQFSADIVSTSIPTPVPQPSMEMKKEVTNITQNSGFVNSVSATEGDILEYRIWVHNKVVGSTAKDVLVKDTLSTSESQTFVNKAFVSGDNFTTLTDSATTNTAFVGRLEYISGTTRTFVHADNSEGVLIPDVNGKSKLFGSGVSLGNIKGCFEFERFVTFRVKVIKPRVLSSVPTQLPNTGPGIGLLMLFGSVPAGFVLRTLKKRI